MSTVFQEGDVLPSSRTMVFKILLYLCGVVGGGYETFMFFFYLFIYVHVRCNGR